MLTSPSLMIANHNKMYHNITYINRIGQIKMICPIFFIYTFSIDA